MLTFYVKQTKKKPHSKGSLKDELSEFYLNMFLQWLYFIRIYVKKPTKRGI